MKIEEDSKPVVSAFLIIIILSELTGYSTLTKQNLRYKCYPCIVLVRRATYDTCRKHPRIFERKEEIRSRHSFTCSFLGLMVAFKYFTVP